MSLAERGLLAHLTEDLGVNSKRPTLVPYSQVASTYGVSDRTVGSYLQKLAERGYITVEVGSGRVPTRVRLTK